jgi:hypothetical protein
MGGGFSILLSWGIGYWRFAGIASEGIGRRNSGFGGSEPSAQLFAAEGMLSMTCIVGRV